MARNNNELGHSLRKVLDSLLDDYQSIGIEKSTVEIYRNKVAHASNRDIVKEVTECRNNVLFGGIPLVFLIDFPEAKRYIDVFALVNKDIPAWFAARAVSSSSGGSGGGITPEEISQSMEMLSAVLGTSANNPILNMAKDLVADIGQDMPSNGTGMADLLKRVQDKIQSKIENNDLDITALAGEAQSLMSKIDSSPKSVPKQKVVAGADKTKKALSATLQQ